MQTRSWCDNILSSFPSFMLQPHKAFWQSTRQSHQSKQRCVRQGLVHFPANSRKNPNSCGCFVFNPCSVTRWSQVLVKMNCHDEKRSTAQQWVSNWHICSFVLSHHQVDEWIVFGHVKKNYDELKKFHSWKYFSKQFMLCHLIFFWFNIIFHRVSALIAEWPTISTSLPVTVVLFFCS